MCVSAESRRSNTSRIYAPSHSKHLAAIRFLSTRNSLRSFVLSFVYCKPSFMTLVLERVELELGYDCSRVLRFASFCAKPVEKSVDLT